jgi:hypothetical protein
VTVQVALEEREQMMTAQLVVVMVTILVRNVTVLVKRMMNFKSLLKYFFLTGEVFFWGIIF